MIEGFFGARGGYHQQDRLDLQISASDEGRVGLTCLIPPWCDRWHEEMARLRSKDDGGGRCGVSVTE